MYRIHLRHTGDDKLRFGTGRMAFGHPGLNIYLGYWFIAIRTKVEGGYKAPLIDLSFGKSQQRTRRMRRSEAYRRGMDEGARHVLEAWISEEGRYFIHEDLLKFYQLEEINGHLYLRRQY
jgi:hypothetical protein